MLAADGAGCQAPSRISTESNVSGSCRADRLDGDEIDRVIEFFPYALCLQL
jgi:hypothetical protein